MSNAVSHQKSSQSPRLRGILRDLNDALIQQMFFWGRDVLHPSGNLLSEYGLDRRRSEGLDGTSCYRMTHEDAIVELHGACVGRYEKDRPGFLFVRTRRNCFLYDSEEPPAPGLYAEELMRSQPAGEVFEASQRFLRWWLDYESWIDAVTEAGYREHCYRMFRKLPKAKPWLPPSRGEQWLRACAEAPESLSRARDWKKSNAVVS